MNGVREVGFSQIGEREASSVQVGSIEVSSKKNGFENIGSLEVGSAKVGKGEYGSTKIGITQVCIAEFGKVAVAEVRPYFWKLFPPLIPNISSLLENSKVFVVCHKFFSLLTAIRISGFAKITSLIGINV